MYAELLPVMERQESLLAAMIDLLKSLLPPAARPPEAKLMDGNDVQALLKISRNTLLRLRKRGELKPVLIGRRAYYLKSDIMNRFAK